MTSTTTDLTQHPAIRAYIEARRRGDDTEAARIRRNAEPHFRTPEETPCPT